MPKVKSNIRPKLGTKAHKELKYKEAIYILNQIATVELKPSKIHGVGVFAVKGMKKGEKMYLNIIPNMFDIPYKKFNELRDEVVEILLSHFPTKIAEKEPEPFWYPVNHMQAYLNHSDKPNYDPDKDVLLKNVKKGDEITEDYRKIKGWEKVYTWLKD